MKSTILRQYPLVIHNIKLSADSRAVGILRKGPSLQALEKQYFVTKVVVPWNGSKSDDDFKKKWLWQCETKDTVEEERV